MDRRALLGMAAVLPLVAVVGCAGGPVALASKRRFAGSDLVLAAGVRAVARAERLLR
jgi:hypothetical protein